MTMSFDLKILKDLPSTVSTRDVLFLERIFSKGLDRYKKRLSAIGFENLGYVLDSGCGFGQWSLVLSETCRHIEAFDISSDRIRIAKQMGKNIPNLKFREASLENMPFEDESCDAVFCYSSIYYTDVKKSVSELCRVLRKGGSIYISSNGIGWYIYNFIKQPNKSHDFNPQTYALKAVMDSLKYFILGKSPLKDSSIITSRRFMSKLLKDKGIELILCGGEGTINLNSHNNTVKRFFPDRYFGLECVSEWLGRKV